MSAEMLKGAPVAAAMNAATSEITAHLIRSGLVPTLAIVRVGSRESDLSYERSAEKRCAGVGIAVKKLTLPHDVTPSHFERELQLLNSDVNVHGILLLRPLPEQLDEDAACRLLAPEKDVDGVTSLSHAAVYSGSGTGFAPCTARAVTELLDYYRIPCAGKRAVIVGRSLVVGRPLSMLLLQRNASVTICHSHTRDLAELTRQAELVVFACGKAEAFGAEYVSPGQTVIDVGINWCEARQKLCGDVNMESASKTVSAITPVPGGIGAVTTAVLARQVAEAAAKKLNIQ